MTYIYIALFSIFFIYLAQKNFLWAIAFITAFLPSYLVRFKIGFVPFTLLELMILILFLVWLVKGKDKKLGSFKYPIIFWLLAATISIFTSSDLQSALGVWKAYFIEPILFFIVLINVVKTTGSFANAQSLPRTCFGDDKKKTRNDNNYVILSKAKNPKLDLIFLALGFSALYISLFAIWQKFTGQGVLSLQSWQGEKILRVTSIFKYPNAIGLFLAPIILFFIRQKTKKIFYLITSIIALLAIIFAKSEGAILGIMAGLFFLIIFHSLKNEGGETTKKLARKFTLSGIIIFIIFILFTPSLKNYLWQKATLQDFSGQIRKEMWQETWQMLKQKPIFGAGLAGYQNAMIPFHKKSYIEIYLYPHNLFLNFWSELGLFGLIIFLWIIIKFFNLGFKNKNNILAISAMAAMTALLVHGLVDAPYFKNDLSILFWLIIGTMEISNNQKLDN